MTFIQATDGRIAYTGRLTHGDAETTFYWPASRAAVRFTGTSLKAFVTPNTVYGCNALGIWVDGRLSAAPVKAEHQGRRTEYLLADNLEPEQEHTCILYKKQDCGYSFVLHGFETDGDFLSAPEKPDRKLEFYGDSVTSGYAVACVDYVGRTDPPSNESVFDDSWWSYASITGRKLKAETHCVSQGGIAIFNRTGYFHYPDVIGMEDTYDKLCYFPEAGALTAWDFSRFIPDAVVFAIGQNDHHNPVTETDDLTVADPAYRVRWKEAYSRIAKSVAGHYPKGTPLVFITTLICHDPCWDEAIGEMVEALRQEGLNAHHFLFQRNGRGTLGHPRIPEQQEMADELAPFLASLLGWTEDEQA